MCFQDPVYAIFIKSRGFKDLKYYIGCLLVKTKTKTKSYVCQKQGVRGFRILYWLSSCDDKDKDKDTILCIIRAEYFID